MRDVKVVREVVGLLQQRVGVLQGELRLVRDEVPVVVSETVVRVQGEVQRVMGDMTRRLAAQRDENRALQQQLLSQRRRMESLLLEHHRHSRQYAALLAEQEDVLKPASLSPLPLPLAYTKDTLRPTHHRTITSHSQPTPSSSDTATTSSSNNTQRSSSQPRDSQLTTQATAENQSASCTLSMVVVRVLDNHCSQTTTATQPTMTQPSMCNAWRAVHRMFKQTVITTLGRCHCVGLCILTPGSPVSCHC